GGAVAARSGEYDAVGLPFARPAGRVDERRVLSINRRGLTVRVRDVVKAVEDLDFVPAHEKDAAVAAILILASRRIRRRPLDMQLAVAEFIPGRDVAGPRGDDEL